MSSIEFIVFNYFCLILESEWNKNFHAYKKEKSTKFFVYEINLEK